MVIITLFITAVIVSILLFTATSAMEYNHGHVLTHAETDDATVEIEEATVEDEDDTIEIDAITHSDFVDPAADDSLTKLRKDYSFDIPPRSRSRSVGNTADILWTDAQFPIGEKEDLKTPTGLWLRYGTEDGAEPHEFNSVWDLRKYDAAGKPTSTGITVAGGEEFEQLKQLGYSLVNFTRRRARPLTTGIWDNVTVTFDVSDDGRLEAKGAALFKKTGGTVQEVFMDSKEIHGFCKMVETGFIDGMFRDYEAGKKKSDAFYEDFPQNRWYM